MTYNISFLKSSLYLSISVFLGNLSTQSNNLITIPSRWEHKIQTLLACNNTDIQHHRTTENHVVYENKLSPLSCPFCLFSFLFLCILSILFAYSVQPKTSNLSGKKQSKLTYLTHTHTHTRTHTQTWVHTHIHTHAHTKSIKWQTHKGLRNISFATKWNNNLSGQKQSTLTYHTHTHTRVHTHTQTWVHTHTHTHTHTHIHTHAHTNKEHQMADPQRNISFTIKWNSTSWN